MDALTLYLVKSALWLSAFALVYHVFLRNERYFLLNRLFLITGLIAALIMPFVSINLPVQIVEAATNQASVTVDLPVAQTIVTNTSTSSISYIYVLNLLFIAGLITFIIRLSYQTIKVFLIILQSKSNALGNLKVIKTDLFPAPFSFFSYVFVNPSITDIETREIVNHEAEHIRQHHWLDLMLSETVCLVQWFNPVAWLYGHYIRQNHEYLADTMALKRTNNPAVYRAVLINQLLGGEAIRLGHMFSYSLNKKRFTMMTHISIKPIHKAKLLLAIPAIIGVLFACSELDENYGSRNASKINSVNIPAKEDGMIVYVDNMIYDIQESILNDLLKPELLQSINVLKGDNALQKYGVLGRNGVIEITTKNGDFANIYKDFVTNLTEEQQRKMNWIDQRTKDGDEIFMLVQQMPLFPGGDEALRNYLATSLKYPEEANAQRISGRVYVQFVINTKGKTEKIKILRGVHPLLDSEAFRVVDEMPDWQPGMHDGSPVAVSYTVPINFVIN